MKVYKDNSTASPCITMLELKFIMFVDFPKKMKGGIYLTCADDIELFESEGMQLLEYE